MEAKRRSRRGSAASQLSAILRPFEFYEPLTLDALEETEWTSISQQSELPTWTRRPASSKSGLLATPVHRHSRFSWHTEKDKSREALPASGDWTDLTKPLPTVVNSPHTVADMDDASQEHGSMRLQAAMHSAKRSSYRLSQRSMISQTSLQRMVSNGSHRSPSESRRSQRRTSQKLSALPPMPNRKESVPACNSVESPLSPPTPPIPPRALSRIRRLDPAEGQDPNLVL